MLTIQAALQLINDKKPKEHETDWLCRWRDVYYGMSLHIDGARPQYVAHIPGSGDKVVTPPNWFGERYQEIFDVSIFNRHPRESIYARNWRMSVYRAFTQDPFLRIIQVVRGTIFQDGNYSITVEDKADNEYIWGPNFDGNSLVGYVSKHFQGIAEDPNALFVVVPSAPWYETRGAEVKPTIHFVHTKDIVYISSDEIIYKRGGLIWLVNKVAIFRFRPTDKEGREWVLYDAGNGYYGHNLGRVPYHFAGGQWNSQGFYESWFSAGKNIADDYAGTKSASQMADKEVSHPYVQIGQTDCPDCKGGGQMQYCNSCNHNDLVCRCTGDPTDTTRYRLGACHKCGGSGRINLNPGEYLQVPLKDMDKDFVKLVNPDVDINRYHADNARQLFKDLIASLHLYQLDQAQSGEAKKIDLEPRYNFFVTVSNDLFDRLIRGLLVDILAYRNVRQTPLGLAPAVPPFTMVKPASFKIQTEGELLALFEAAKTSKMPVATQQIHLLDYIDKRYGNNDQLQRQTEIMLYVDPLALFDAAEIEQMVTAGAADQRDWKFHIQFPRLITKLYRTNPTLFNTGDLDVIRQTLWDLFNADFPPPPLLQ